MLQLLNNSQFVSNKYVHSSSSLIRTRSTIEHIKFYHHLPPGLLSLPELFPQTPVSSYSWPRSTQVADKIVSPSCFRSSLPPCPFSWCPLCHSFSPPVVVETCNVSRPSVYSLLDNVYDVIYTCLMSYPGITFVVMYLSNTKYKNHIIEHNIKEITEYK